MPRTEIARNFSIQVFSRILGLLVGLVSIGIMTRTLGVHGFGEYTTALTYLQLFGVIVDFGLTLTLVVMISEEHPDTERIVGNIFGLRMIAGAFVFGIAALTILTIPWSNAIKQAVLVGTVGYVMMGGATLLVGVFQRYQAMWRAGIAEIVNRLVLLGFIALFAYLNLGVAWMMGAGVIANVVWLFAMIRLAKPFVHIRFLTDVTLWKHIWTRSWPIAISIFFNLLYLKGDILFLGYFRSQEEVGLYGVAYRVIDMLTALPVMFMGILLPLAVNHWSLGNQKAFRSHVIRTFDLFMIAAVPIVVGTQAVAQPLIELIAGPGYELSADILKLLILVVFGVFMGALFGHLVVAINKQKPMTWGYVAVAILSIIGYFLVIPTYGVWGAAWMTLFSEGLIAIITFTVVYRITHVHPQFTIMFKAAFASLIMYGFLLFSPINNLVANIFLAMSIYLFAMVILKGIKPEEIQSLMKRNKQLA